MSLPDELQNAATAAKETLDASVLAFIKNAFEVAIAKLASSISKPVSFSFPRERAWMDTLEAMFTIADVSVTEGHRTDCAKIVDPNRFCSCISPEIANYTIQRRI